MNKTPGEIKIEKEKYPEVHLEPLSGMENVLHESRAPQEELISRDLSRVILEIINSLSEEKRKILRLWIEGYSVYKISKTLGLRYDRVEEEKNSGLRIIRARLGRKKSMNK